MKKVYSIKIRKIEQIKRELQILKTQFEQIKDLKAQRR
jgi:hypothetical protein